MMLPKPNSVRKRKSRYLRLPILIGIIVLFLVAIAVYMMLKINQMTQEKEHDKIYVGVVLSPQAIKISEEKLSGLQVDLIRLLPPLQKPYEIIPYSSEAKAVEELKEGKLDLLANSNLYSLNSGEDLYASSPLYDSSYVLIRKKSKSPFSYDSLRYKEIALPAYSSDMDMIIRHLSEESIPELKIKRTDYTQEEIIQKVASEEIDYAICERELAKSYAEKLASLDTETQLSFELHHSWLISDKNKQMRKQIDSVLTIATQKPEWEQTLKKYGLQAFTGRSTKNNI